MRLLQRIFRRGAKGCALLVTLFVLLAAVVQAADEPPKLPASNVGLQTHVKQIVLPGTELEPVAWDAKLPLLLQIDAVYPHGTNFRYDLSYQGLEAGQFDLRKFLRRKDGSTVEDLPPLEKSRDQDVVRNILDDLPLEYAFRSGGTNIFAGLEEAAKIAHPWQPKSATLVLVSDGDTVPATGMPRMPASIAKVLVLGVGNPREGKFINGRNSRQEASQLRQIATRLGGVYHDGNEKHISTDVIHQITQAGAVGTLDRLSLREYALLVCAITSTLLALLPLALQHFGTRWIPGVRFVRGVQEPNGRGVRESTLERPAEKPVARSSTRKEIQSCVP